MRIFINKKKKGKTQEQPQNWATQNMVQDPKTGDIHMVSQYQYDDGNGNSGFGYNYQKSNPNNGGNNSLSNNLGANPQIGRED